MTQTITLQPTDKVLSCHSGLVFFEDLWKRLKLDNKLRRLLPKKKRRRGLHQVSKFKGLLFSFAVGNDCIDDLDELREDALFQNLVGGDFPARTAGDFLSQFHRRQIEKIQDLLLEITLTMRIAIFADKKFILSMDATPHEQHAKKMEGLGFNYKGIWGLDSQNAYDQYGFSYLFDLRPGGTHSGKDSERWIYKIFSRLPSWMEKYFRADSAYGKQSTFGQLHIAGVKYTIVLKENIGKYVRKKNRNFLKWQKTEVEFFNSKDCEIAMGLYPLKQLGDLRVVFIRTKKSEEEIAKQLELFKEYDPEEDHYKYYSIITNIPCAEMTGEAIIEFYKGRGNCENYIREQKYNFDFLHFPCKKLMSNKAWGLIGTLAHNMTRFLSLCMPQKIKSVRGKDGEIRKVTQLGYFAKKVRNKLIKIPCQVVRSARRINLKINYFTLEVLNNFMTTFNFYLSRIYHENTT